MTDYIALLLEHPEEDETQLWEAGAVSPRRSGDGAGIQPGEAALRGTALYAGPEAWANGPEDAVQEVRPQRLVQSIAGWEDGPGAAPAETGAWSNRLWPHRDGGPAENNAVPTAASVRGEGGAGGIYRVLRRTAKAAAYRGGIGVAESVPPAAYRGGMGVAESVPPTVYRGGMGAVALPPAGRVPALRALDIEFQRDARRYDGGFDTE